MELLLFVVNRSDGRNFLKLDYSRWVFFRLWVIKLPTCVLQIGWGSPDVTAHKASKALEQAT